ncbi:MAG: hypothetical protein KME43_23390 [Myxacorys chilensis ATA2-1-KO14]|nr:hypothetical protein [Myxacorys chilensis ATA2-1-KO14]
MEESPSCPAMLTYAKLAKTPAKFQRFTGLTVEEFDQLVRQSSRCGKRRSEGD